MINGSAGVNFNAFEHFGVGLAYNYFELDVSIDKSSWRGDIETTYDGVSFYVNASF